MRQFTNVCAQGELTIRRIGEIKKSAKLPNDYKKLELENNLLIVGHSETGHHHYFRHNDGVEVGVIDEPNGMRILRAILTEPNVLDHAREVDKHESIALEPGVYDIRIAREFDHNENLIRMVKD